jgi:hypothetical protein
MDPDDSKCVPMALDKIEEEVKCENKSVEGCYFYYFEIEKV